MHMTELTICSVYHKEEARDLLDLNWRLTNEVNYDVHTRWVVTDNSPQHTHIAPPGKSIEVFPGFEISEFENIYPKSIIYPFHASSGLNNLLPHVKTRFVLFLDADFFIIRPHWIRDVIAYMEEHNLAAFGAPWHPQYSRKVRYLPMQACMFVDTSLIPVMELSFHPSYPFRSTHLTTNPHGVFPVKKTRGSSLLERCMGVIEERWGIGQSRDVSYRIGELLKESGLPVELVQPVWKKGDHAGALNRAIDMFLPERFSVMPKRKHYFSESGFHEKGLYNFYADCMEEYMWRGEPFSVHIRNTSKRKSMPDAFTQLERSLFSTLQSRVDSRPL